MRLRLLFLSLVMAAALPSARAGMISPIPYLSAADSPFNPASFSYFYRETFETHVLTVPGVTPSTGSTATAAGYSGSIIDSVDGDDGIINGTCHKTVGDCDSWFSIAGSAGVTWTFNAGVLGSLPTAAGIVWTDGGVGTTVTFKAYDGSHNLLGTLTVASSDGDNFGGTAEDRFFGVTNAAGIGSIFMSNDSGGIEMDHLQYGGGTANAVPEPGTVGLAAAGLIGLVLIGRRRLSAHS